MCQYWHTDLSLFDSRIDRKWSLENALTLPKGAKVITTKKYVDHMGNEFRSMQEMADYWNIPLSTLQHRITDIKLPIKDALTKSTDEIKPDRTCHDHIGNSFPSKKAMCEHYGIPITVYHSRIRLGWSMEKSLTEPIADVPGNTKTATDHTGQKFRSISEMCKAWNITRSLYNIRIKSGCSIEEALTMPKKDMKITKQNCTDHLGNEYASINAMCRAYGVTRACFQSRITDLGWDTEKALTTPVQTNAKKISDGMGNIFPSLVDICYFYNIPPYSLQGKILTDELIAKTIRRGFKKNMKFKNGMTIKKVLEFPYYMVDDNGHDIICSFEQLLDVYHNNEFYPFPKKLNSDELKIEKLLSFPDYEVTYKTEKQIWSYWKLIQYRHDAGYTI
jgi:hypothetical protein